jgi:predicted RNA-binding Zn-ribbon protein involved in translation (DUF1610 family)
VQKKKLKSCVKKQMQNASLNSAMPSSRKINLEKVWASLDAMCPKCGRVIPPAEGRRIDFERIECPVCGERFVPYARVGCDRDLATCPRK